MALKHASLSFNLFQVERVALTSTFFSKGASILFHVTSVGEAFLTRHSIVMTSFTQATTESLSILASGTTKHYYFYIKIFQSYVH